MHKDILSNLNLEALLITKPENIRYLTGFKGDTGYLVVTAKQSYLVTNAIYAAESQDLKIKIIQSKIGHKTFARLLEIISKHSIREIGYEDGQMTVATFENLKSDLKNIKLIPLGKKINQLRIIKSKIELENIKKAAEIASQVLIKLFDILKPGLCEKDVAAELEYWIRKMGGDKDSFEPIVASGFRSAYPHTNATGKIIKAGELIKIDFGVKYNGYCSDLTRTFILGKASAEQKKIYQVVKSAQERAMAAVKPEVSGHNIDKIARDIITKAGYGKRFIHSTGHGLGLEIHELPRIGEDSQDILKAGMTITIEPGIYIPSFGGVRIEDTLVVTKDGSKIITKVPKELEI